MHIFALRYPVKRETYSLYKATIHATGGQHTIRGVARFALWMRALADLRAEHARAPFNVIHAMWADETGVVAALAGKLLRVPVVTSLAGGELVRFDEYEYGLQRSRSMRALVRFALHNATLVTAPCSYTHSLAAQEVPLAKLRTVPLGVRADMFTPHDLPPRLPLRRKLANPHLVAVGSLIPLKRHAALIELIARSTLPNLTLEIIGSGPLASQLHRQIAALGLTRRVTIRPACNRYALPPRYRAADLHLLASPHEAFGMVTIEAAACGVPTVACPVGVAADLANEGAACVAEQESFLDAVEGLLHEPDRIAEMGNRARAAVETRYTVAAMVDGFAAVYRELC